QARQGLLAVASVLVFAACAAPGSVDAQARSPSRGHRPTPNWDGPMLIYAQEVQSMTDAANGVPFIPIASQGLGDPIHIYVSDPAAVPLQDRAINLIYQHPT